MDIFIPKVRLRQFQFPRWFTPDIRHKYKCLEKKCVNNPSSSNIVKKVKATGDLREEIELAKASYERRLINDFARTNNSRIYKYLGELRRGSDIPSTVHDDVASASASKDKANLFNNYFHSVFTVSNFSLPPWDELPEVDPSICNMDLCESDVYKVLYGLDATKAKGLDGIGPSVLKHCALALYQPMHHLFRASISLHQLPGEWKIHCITPIHKSGDRGTVSNYRPISLLSSTSKVLERLIYDKLISFLKEFISPVQFGFLKGHSTLQQLLLFYGL